MQQSNLPNHTAGNFLPGIPRRLTAEIIRPVVDYHRPSDNLLRAKPVCHHRHKRLAPAAQQRRQISGMAGVFPALRVVVTAGVGEILPRQLLPSWMWKP